MSYQSQSLAIGALLFLGFVGGKVAQKYKMPAISGYVLVGILMGPSFLNLISPDLEQSLGVIKVLGISIIALIIGGELEIKKLKTLGKSIYVISGMLAVGSFLAVFVSLYYLLGMDLPMALLLSAIATSTAPGAIIAVREELKSRGTLTSTLIGTVAFADIFSIIGFGLTTAVVTYLLGSQGQSTLDALMLPVLELMGSSFLGAVTGISLVYVLKWVKSKEQVMTLLVAIAFLNSGFSYMFHFSPLLTNMVTGFVVANLHLSPRQVFSVLEEVEFPIFIVFFALAGATLHMQVLFEHWFIAVIYTLARALGIAAGVYLGAYISRANGCVQRYAGLAFFSKAGISIGYLLIVQGQFPEIATIVTAVELSAIAICQVVGPMGVKFALIKAGEANTDGKNLPSSRMPQISN